MNRAQGEGLAQGYRQVGDGAAQALSVVGGDEPRFGVGRRLARLPKPVAFEIAYVGVGVAGRFSSRQKGQGDVADDGQQPGARLLDLLRLQRR